MIINIPEALKSHEIFLQEFIEGMVFKLWVNSFKDETVAKDIPVLLEAMQGECAEFREQIDVKLKDPNTLSELFDMANFPYLLFQFLRKSGVPDEREQFIDEFFNVDVVAGKIYSKKTRSGSRYREGEEIGGTWRNGRCYIRTQHAVSGCSVSMPRDHIVFWKSRGYWPSVDPVHKNSDMADDRIINLSEAEQGRPKVLPFVAQYKPAGREGTDNYGRWTYQRRYRGVLVKCGYWDDEETAAREGIRAWKAKTKEISF